jgi:hypothetical protein
MKNHTFKIINDDKYPTETIFPIVEMSIDSEASLGDMLQAFETFLKAAGYILPENSVLDFIEE